MSRRLSGVAGDAASEARKEQFGLRLSASASAVIGGVAAGPTSRYPFGREALGPLMVGVQGLVLLGTLLYASVAAVLTIRSGGSEAAVGSALPYALLSLAVSVGLLSSCCDWEPHRSWWAPRRHSGGRARCCPAC